MVADREERDDNIAATFYDHNDPVQFLSRKSASRHTVPIRMIKEPPDFERSREKGRVVENPSPIDSKISTNLHPSILAGDIGGTKTLLGLFPAAPGKGDRNQVPPTFFKKEYPSRHFDSLEKVLESFLEDARSGYSKSFSIAGAAFGIAGPVVKGRCQTTNLPWIVETETLGVLLGLSVGNVLLVNDLVAMAWGTTCLDPKEIPVINEGHPDPLGTRIIVAPGTGLGESVLVPGEQGPVVIPTEGGHSDWAPESPADIPLLTYLWSRFGHASVERVVSGQGLANLYHFHTQGLSAEGLPLDPALTEDEIPAALTHAALSRHDPLCTMILENFCRFLGQEAGNLALKSLATGGVYLAGGIPGKIQFYLMRSSFMDHFTNKGRYRKILSEMPVYIVDNPETGLRGSWQLAMRRVTGTQNQGVAR